MFNHIDDLLVGLSFTASIGEPWDFVSSVGQNRLDGKIIAGIFLDSGQPCFLCTVMPFIMAGVRVTTVVGVNRYRGSQDLVKVLKAGEKAILNFVFLTSGYAISSDDIANVLSGNKGETSFLVGSMKLDEL